MNSSMRNSFTLAAALMMASASSRADNTFAGYNPYATKSPSNSFVQVHEQVRAARYAQRNAPGISLEEINALLEKIPTSLDNAPGFLVYQHNKAAFAVFDVPGKAKTGIQFYVSGDFSNPTLVPVKIFNLDSVRSNEHFSNTVAVNENLNKARASNQVSFSTTAPLNITSVTRDQGMDVRFIDGFQLQGDSSLGAYKNARLFDPTAAATSPAVAQAQIPAAPAGVQAEAPSIPVNNSSIGQPASSNQTTQVSATTSTNAALPVVNLGAVNLAAQRVGVDIVFEKQKKGVSEVSIPSTGDTVGYIFNLNGTNATLAAVANLNDENSRNNFFDTIKAISILDTMHGGTNASATHPKYHIVSQSTLPPEVHGFKINLGDPKNPGAIKSEDLPWVDAEKVDVKVPAASAEPTKPGATKPGPSALIAHPAVV